MKTLRTYAIVDYLKQKKYCSIQDLIDHFHVSSATMYRDIAELTARDVVQKVHGGIAINERPAGQKISASSPFQERIRWNREKKEAIALQAIRRIEGMTSCSWIHRPLSTTWRSSWSSPVSPT